MKKTAQRDKAIDRDDHASQHRIPLQPLEDEQVNDQTVISSHVSNTVFVTNYHLD